ncbi:hypothetical protein HDU67_007544 [Dinochytrium kinnereticum]|nr:hypothetical protein HDU67_007544 [Dinochytrium kinnereticum]
MLRISLPSFTATQSYATSSPTPSTTTALNGVAAPSPVPIRSKDPGFASSGKFENEMTTAGAAGVESAQPVASGAAPPAGGGRDGTTPLSAEDLSVSYKGASQEPFPKHIVDVLLGEIPDKDIEIKPEIKYRRILNRAFGPGGWGLVPRGPHTIGNRTISREYALFCLGRFVSQARGEQDYFSEDGLPTATEGCKSNALMRCCKDLGIASELWDPAFIREFKQRACVNVWAVSGSSGARKSIWRRADRTLEGAFREEGIVGGAGGAGAANGGGSKAPAGSRAAPAFSALRRQL